MIVHCKLKNFNIITWSKILENEGTAVEFAKNVGLIPDLSNEKCILCKKKLRKEKREDKKLRYIYRCSNGKRTDAGDLVCGKFVSPLQNTFFEGMKLNIKDVLAIVFCFVREMKVTEVVKEMNAWRAEEGEKEVSCKTVVEYYSFLREIAEIFASHNHQQLGGPNKTIDIAETFLTKRRYRGRITNQMKITVLGLYCPEDKEGLFLRVKSESKKDLWPYIKKYCHPQTSIICTDEAKQYCDVKSFFVSNTELKTANHSESEFVSKTDPKNTINPLENQNKLMKGKIINRRSDKLLYQYMCLHFYRRTRLQHYELLGEKVQQFVNDIVQVYPGYNRTGLKLVEIETATCESENISLPLKKTEVTNIREILLSDT